MMPPGLTATRLFPKELKFLKGKRREQAGFRGSLGFLSLAPVSPTLYQKLLTHFSPLQ